MSARRKKRLAIIGAGPAGLAAAWKLRDASDIEITVFEKSRGGCGRAASRSRHGVQIDPGANYLRTDLPDVADLIHEQLPSDELIEIVGDIDVFDRHGTISPGQPEANAERKWTYRNGINTLGRLLTEAAGCEIGYGIRVARIRQHPGSTLWQVLDDNDGDCGLFDAVLLTLPAPQALELLATTHAGIVEALASATYQSQWSFTFGFDAAALAWPGESYALINHDRQHRVAWLSRENAKPGRIPDHTLAVMAQMQPQWSLENFERPSEALAPEVSAIIADLLGWGTAGFRWFDAKRWKFSLPTGRADTAKLRAIESSGLYIAGDSLLGKGRVTLSLQTGLDVAQRIRDSR
jgi:predicted NAD/FAD-dependent oxidoreductase